MLGKVETYYDMEKTSLSINVIIIIYITEGNSYSVTGKKEDNIHVSVLGNVGNNYILSNKKVVFNVKDDENMRKVYNKVH